MWDAGGFSLGFGGTVFILITAPYRDENETTQAPSQQQSGKKIWRNFSSFPTL